MSPYVKPAAHCSRCGDLLMRTGAPCRRCADRELGEAIARTYRSRPAGPTKCRCPASECPVHGPEE